MQQRLLVAAATVDPSPAFMAFEIKSNNFAPLRLCERWAFLIRAAVLAKAQRRKGRKEETPCDGWSYFSKAIKAGLSSHGRCRDREKVVALFFQ
jgi:hypothetical protein